MQTIVRWGGIICGLIVALHGISLLFLNEGLLRTGTKWSMFESGFKGIFGEEPGQLLKAGIWFGTGMALTYFSVSRPRAKADHTAEPPSGL